MLSPVNEIDPLKNGYGLNGLKLFMWKHLVDLDISHYSIHLYHTLY